MELSRKFETNPMVSVNEAVNLLAYLSILSFGVEFSETVSEAYSRYKKHIHKILFSNPGITKEIRDIHKHDDGQISAYEVDDIYIEMNGFNGDYSLVNINELLSHYNDSLKKNDQRPISLSIQSECLHINNNEEKSLRVSKRAMIKCQAIAQTLWSIYPKMSITDMIKHDAILDFGDGKNYPGKNTLRDWISEVDPRPDDTKPGRAKTNSLPSE